MRIKNLKGIQKNFIFNQKVNKPNQEICSILSEKNIKFELNYFFGC